MLITLSEKLTKKAYDQIMELLPRLSDTEKSRLKSALSALKGISNHKENQSSGPARCPSGDSENVDIILSAISDTLKIRSIEYAHSKRLKKARNYPSFALKVKDMESFINQFDCKTEKISFINIAIELLVDHLFLIDVRPSATSIMAMIHLLPVVVDQEFPGYARQGMLS